MRASVIATVLNEGASVGGLLESLIQQTRAPDEVVVLDGGSTDGTLAVLESYSGRLPLKVIVEEGCNISRGRNLAIAAASGPIIAATDAGVRLSPQWLEELTRPLENSQDTKAIAAGFFLADPRSIFELALGATILPSAEEIRPSAFLPSSRSVAFYKEAWEKAGGFPEWLDYCEDLIFDFRLLKSGCRILWVPQAVVYFRPRPSLGAFFLQYYRYARGDGKADLWRRRHLARYAAYLGGVGLALGGLSLPILWGLLLLGAALYLYPPYRRLVPSLKALSWGQKMAALGLVPLIRVVGDGAKMAGYPMGVTWRLLHRPPKPF